MTSNPTIFEQAIAAGDAYDEQLRQAAPTAQDKLPPNTITPKEQAEGWHLLFDGRTTTGWRGYRQPTLPDGWRVVDGALTRVGQAGDIVTTGQFSDFELTLEWKLQANGNSGLFPYSTTLTTFGNNGRFIYARAKFTL